MKVILRTPRAKVVIGKAVLAILVMVGYYVVREFRDRNDDDVLVPPEALRNFRELHHKGDISDVEFRTINTTLKDQLQEELKDTGEEG